MVNMKRIWSLLLAVLAALFLLTACSQETADFLLDTALDILEESTTEPTESAPLPDAEYDAPTKPSDTSESTTDSATQLSETGSYTTKEDVALYLHLYKHLPDNFITKKEAQALGWPGGDLKPYAPGKSIGGDRFGNYEGLLPDKKGRSYQECDIDTLGSDARGAKRLVYSNDGLIYYTDDHYKTFELLYGEE